MKRREFLKLAGLTAAGGLLPQHALTSPGGGFDLITNDEVSHILPTVSHDRMLIKVSYFEPQTTAPVLKVGAVPVAGVQTDSDGLFWRFDVTGLSADTTYSLQLEKASCPVFEPWQLRTFPDPASSPTNFRLLVFTCAGGHDIFDLYVPMPVRQRMLERALSFGPDAALCVGDHIYWDLRSLPGSLFLGNSSTAKGFAGEFDRLAPVLGSANETVLKKAADYQIARLYGTAFRSVPVFFMRDDHDYFEDDRADGPVVTFPADPFQFDLARSTQNLYFPEFLPDAARPLTLAASNAPDRPTGVSEVFGSLRYGQLLEAVMYDCKGFVTLDGATGLLTPADTESWILDRLANSAATHVVNVPSNPIGYSVGKYAEWYPDVVIAGQLSTSQPKTGWQQGWQAQHDRILQATFDRGGVPLVVSGDVHSIAEQLIVANGAADFSTNPVVSLVSGTPATGRFGWPSVVRGTLAGPPTDITAQTVVPTDEVNGFHIIDFDPTTVTIQHFRWDIDTEPLEAIDTLSPFHVSTYTV